MIKLTRLDGSQLWVNADLVASVDQRPDTSVALVDGRHLVVRESPTEVAAEMTRFRASILALAEEMVRTPAGGEHESVMTDAEPDKRIYLISGSSPDQAD